MAAARPPTIREYPADFSVDRGGERVVAIVIHGTGGTNSLDTLQHGGGRKVSAHTLHPKNGDIYRLVPDERGANHAGAASSSFTLAGRTYKAGKINQVTLGLEIENLQTGRDPYTDAQLLSAGFQIVLWRKKFGHIPILRHAELDPTRRRDPYQLTTNQLEQWAARATDVFFPLPPTTRWQIIAPCAPLTSRDANRELVLGVVFIPGDIVNVGDVTQGWLWVSDRSDTAPGIGFIPSAYARPV